MSVVLRDEEHSRQFWFRAFVFKDNAIRASTGTGTSLRWDPPPYTRYAEHIPVQHQVAYHEKHEARHSTLATFDNVTMYGATLRPEFVLFKTAGFNNVIECQNLSNMTGLDILTLLDV